MLSDDELRALGWDPANPFGGDDSYVAEPLEATLRELEEAGQLAAYGAAMHNARKARAGVRSAGAQLVRLAQWTRNAARGYGRLNLGDLEYQLEGLMLRVFGLRGDRVLERGEAASTAAAVMRRVDELHREAVAAFGPAGDERLAGLRGNARGLVRAADAWEAAYGELEDTARTALEIRQRVAAGG